MGLPIGRNVSWLEAIASTSTCLPTQSNAYGVGLGGEAERVAHASSHQALAPTRRARCGPQKLVVARKNRDTKAVPRPNRLGGQLTSVRK